MRTTSQSAHIKVLIQLLLLLWLCPCVFGQSDPGVHSARTHALAGTGMTLLGIDAIYANPAGLTSLEHTTFHAGSAQSFGLSPFTQVNAAGAVRTGSDGVLFLRMGQFGLDAYQERQIGVGYAMQFADNLSGSLTFEVNQFSIEGYGNAMLPGFGIGFQYRLGKALTFGVAARNPAEIASHDAITLPAVLGIGISYHPTDDIALYGEIEKDVDFEPRIRFGVEYRVIESLTLRVGAAGNPGTFHAGIGLHIRKSLTLDVAAGYHPVLGFTPALGIIYEAK